MDDIDIEEVKARLHEPLILVDVLPSEHFAEEHLPGAINLPIPEIPNRAARALPNPDKEIILYCGGFT